LSYNFNKHINYIKKKSKINLYNDDFSHLDSDNLKRLERMFYMRNNTYSPFKNYRILIDNSTNITNVLETINNISEKNNIRRNDGYYDQLGVYRYIRKNDDESDDDETSDYEPNNKRIVFKNTYNYKKNNEGASSDNFQIIKNNDFTFKNVGGYAKIKEELMQSADILINYEKYKKYNVRVPKGIIFEGPPGNGKTLIAKGFSGELNISYIPVSGSEFSEMYVGVGAGRVRELFKLANENKPCIIFIDEIDAIARKRGNDMVTSNSEKDQTLNQLLINLDGFKSCDGIFLIGATNRVDLLDPALIRPGRIDKNIYIGNPDSTTREEIIKIHLKGKPINNHIPIEYIIEMTGGFSGAQIENLLNEAMLHSLRDNREIILLEDLEFVANRIIAGSQATENKYSDDIINRIVIHELGHAIVGFFSMDHSNLVKIILNLWSHKTPGYTIFENSDEDSNIYTKNGLISHLMVLLGGRVAEEIFYGYSVTTGAKKDLEQAYSLAQSMILHYGMGKQNIYPDLSDQSKYLIDQEINKLLIEAHQKTFELLSQLKDLILDCSVFLKKDNILKPEDIIKIINKKYSYLWNELCDPRINYNNHKK
jgi:cell division protease FtsH